MYTELLSFLEITAVPFVIHRHEPIQTVRDAREKWPLALETLIKTIAFKQQDGRVILAAVRPDDRIAYPKLAGLLEINRRALSPLSATGVKEMLGVPAGGVFPLPLFPAVSRIVFDKQVADLPRVFCGTGRLDRTLELNTEDLLRLSRGVLADIVK